MVKLKLEVGKYYLDGENRIIKIGRDVRSLEGEIAFTQYPFEWDDFEVRNYSENGKYCAPYILREHEKDLVQEVIIIPLSTEATPDEDIIKLNLETMVTPEIYKFIKSLRLVDQGNGYFRTVGEDHPIIISFNKRGYL